MTSYNPTLYAVPLPALEPECAQTFHRRTQLFGADGPAPAASTPQIEALSLPSVVPLQGLSLEEAIVRRRTRREFDAQQVLTLPQLARLLLLSSGRTAPAMPSELAAAGGHRAVPSAGASYAVEVHVIAQRVTGLAPGSYCYEPVGHTLELRRSGSFEEGLRRWTFDQHWMLDAAAVFVMVGRLERIAPRYGSRGYRYMLFEAGHVAQNLYLLGAAHELCVQATGGFVDHAIARLLGLQQRAMILYLVAVGPAASTPMQG